MRTALYLLILAALGLPGARADVVTAGVVATLLVPSSGVVSAAPVTAVAPLGQGIVAWVQFGATQSLNVIFLDSQGNVVSGPAALALPSGHTPWGVAVGASSLGFMLVFDATTAASSSERDLFYRSFDLAGVQTGSGQANTLTNLDETRPACDGSGNGDFAVGWIRKGTTPGASTQGVYLRRFTSVGVPIDPSEARVDDPTSSFGSQDATGVGLWPSGKVVVVWHDGPNGASATTPSPDGHGQAVLARILAANLASLTPVFVVNDTTTFDQFEPAVATDDRSSCVIGWCGDTSGTLIDAYSRRFSDTGAPLDMADVNLTPGNSTSDQLLMSVGMSSNGEAAAAWMDLTLTPGQPGPRNGFARLTQGGALIESAFIEPGGPADEVQAFPRLACDQYGNFMVAYQVTVGTAAPNRGVRLRHFSRNMVNPGLPSPPPGAALTIFLDSPSDAGNVYVLACSAGTGPLPVDTRHLKLDLDILFDLSVFQGGAGVFFSFAGTLSPSGTSNLPGVIIPPDPQLSGATVYFAFATGGGSAVPNGVNTLSDTRAMTIQ